MARPRWLLIGRDDPDHETGRDDTGGVPGRDDPDRETGRDAAGGVPGRDDPDRETGRDDTGRGGPGGVIGGNGSDGETGRDGSDGAIGSDGEPERVFGSCAEIGGLFVDLPEPAVERFALIDCELEAGLREAVAGVGTAHAHLGEVLLETFLHGTVLHETRLREMTLSGVDGDRIELTGRVCADPDLRPVTYMPPVQGFRVRLADGATLGWCRAVDGVFRQRPELEAPQQMTLAAFRPEPWFAAELAGWNDGGSAGWDDSGSAGWDGGGRKLWVSAEVRALAVDGREIRVCERGILGVVTWVRPAGTGLIDIGLDGRALDPFPYAARAMWDAWLVSPPVTVNGWTSLASGLRAEWLHLALAHRRPDLPERPAGETYHLDGRHITDEEGFLCALGEAVNGPGGYLGRDLDGMIDCLLHSDWNVPTPFRLVWNDSVVARRSLDEGRMRTIVEYLASGNVEVILR